MIYADSSFTASLYAFDGNTARANKVYRADRRPILSTAWQELELFNTLRLGTFRARKAGAPVAYQLGNCLRRIRQDLHNGILNRVELDWSSCVRRAALLSERHTESLGVVMRDVWQVACAIELGADTFWTFDADQETLARATGSFPRVAGLKP